MTRLGGGGTGGTARGGAPLFDGYLMVDWSASSVPKRGKDSIWFAYLRRDEGEHRLLRLENPATRRRAVDQIADLLSEERAAGRRVLAGFDFPFGYPAGVARKICGKRGWRGLWAWLEKHVTEGEANQTNRLALAGAVNAAWQGDGPFWGNAAKAEIPGLGRKKPGGYGEALPSEHRIAERLQHAAGGARPKSVWQLSGAGAVGSQALTGIPALERLRTDPRLSDAVAVWPFESGLVAPRAPICLAEVYPSLSPVAPRDGETKDAAQVRGLAERFAALDQLAALAPLFSGSEDLTAEERRRIVAEEAWILGVGYSAEMTKPLPSLADPTASAPGAPPPRGRPLLRVVSGGAPPLRYERDPEAIYAESFAAVRRETRLAHLPADIAEIAIRLVHASGMPETADRLAFSPELGRRAAEALEGGAPVLCDCEMVAAGVIRRLLPRENAVISAIGDPRVPDLARRIGNTRSAAAVELWRERIEGAVVAIGNAPTALFHLLELLDQGWPRPAAILGFPVGFVGAAESKAALAAHARGAAYLTLRGRRGGSALASAAVNALSLIAARRTTAEERG